MDGSVYSSSIIGSPLSRGEGKGASDLSFAFGNVTITTLPPFCYAMLSRFSRVRLCVTPEMAAHQAPPSLGFSRQEHWSGLPFPLQCMKVKRESEVAQSCPTPSDPMDCSPPGSSIHGIFQASVLEWDAIAFSDHFAKKGKRVLSDSLEKPKEIEFVFHPVVVTDFPMDFSSI